MQQMSIKILSLNFQIIADLYTKKSMKMKLQIDNLLHLKHLCLNLHLKEPR